MINTENGYCGELLVQLAGQINAVVNKVLQLQMDNLSLEE